MTNTLYRKLRSDGIGGLLRAVYYRVLPKRLEYFPNCRSLFQSGVGLEIGGPSGMFGRRGSIPVYPIATRIDNCTFCSHTIWEGTISEGSNFIFNNGRPPGRQYICEASNLKVIENSSYDFILSSHCIEHLANPLQGLAEWIRVLKHGGLLILVVPHKDGTFDHRRPVTSLEHLILDLDNHTDEGDMTHLEEILRLHDLAKDPGAGDFQSFQERSKRNRENRCLHHHVFDTRLAIEMANHMGLEILTVELFRPYHIAVIARKTSQGQIVSNEKYRGGAAALCSSSPFPSDRIAQPCRPAVLD
jgi:SAM-dependent methyltransferase